MVYATYEYYVETYNGTAIPESVFQKAVKKASQYIDYFTFGRITEESAGLYPTLPDCACDMAEAIYSMFKNSGNAKEKKSENNDGYSVTYVTEGTDGTLTEDRMRLKLYTIAKVHLMNTGLLNLEV